MKSPFLNVPKKCKNGSFKKGELKSDRENEKKPEIRPVCLTHYLSLYLSKILQNELI